jgi:hypothetical protein
MCSDFLSRSAPIGRTQWCLIAPLFSFQIVRPDAPAESYLQAHAAAMRIASGLLVAKKEKKGLAPLSRFQYDGVRDAITKALFLV